MKCKKCGQAGLSVDDRFCRACGTELALDGADATGDPEQGAPATQAGFEVPIDVENMNFVDAFVTEQLPDSVRPRLLIDQDTPLVVSRWAFGTKLLHFHVYLALHHVSPDADFQTAFEALRQRVGGVKDIKANVVEVKSSFGTSIPNIRFKGTGPMSFLIPTLFAGGVMRSPMPEVYQGWVVHFASSKGWASHDAISAASSTLGYRIVFE